MIKRSIAPPVVRIGDAEITLNAKITNRIASAIVAAARRTSTLDGLKAIQDARAVLPALIAAQRRHSADLSAAVAALKGEPVQAGGTACGLACEAATLKDMLVAADPDLDIADEVEAAITALSDAANLAKQDADAAQAKVVGIAKAMTQAALKALAKDQSPTAAILDIVHPAQITASTPSAIRAQADEVIRASAKTVKDQKRKRQEQQFKAIEAQINEVMQ